MPPSNNNDIPTGHTRFSWPLKTQAAVPLGHTAYSWSAEASSASVSPYAVGVFVEVPGTNGGILKKILRQGTGDATPAAGNMVSVHYSGTLTKDGSKFDSSRDRAGTFEFQVGVGQVIKGWDKGIVTMKKNELCILRCTSEYGYGAMGSPPTIPGGASLDFEVELFNWSLFGEEETMKHMSTEEKLIVALEAKHAGNVKFKGALFEEALADYTRGLDLIRELAQDEEYTALLDESDKETKANELCVSLSLNCAMARLKANMEWKEAIENCTFALSLDSKNIKAHFRMAQAYVKCGEYATAQQKLDLVLVIDPANTDAIAEKTRVQAAQIKAKKAEKEVYSKMFG